MIAPFAIAITYAVLVNLFWWRLQRRPQPEQRERIAVGTRVKPRLFPTNTTPSVRIKK